VRADPARIFDLPGLRRLGHLRIPFGPAVTTLVALGLLGAGTMAILNFRSIKYLAGMIFIGAAGAAFLAIPRKFGFLLYAAGFTMPFFVQVILLDRQNLLLSLTGTFLVAVGLAVTGLATGALEVGRLRWEPRITIPMIVFLCSVLVSMVNTTDKTITVIQIAVDLEMLVIFLIFVNAIRDEKDLQTFLRGFYLAFCLECAIFVIQNILGVSFDVLGNVRHVGATDVESGRIGFQRGTFDAAPAVAALYFSVFTLLLTGLHLSGKTLSLRVSPMLGMVLGGGCLVLAAKRAPLAGFALGLVVITLLIPIYHPSALRRLARVLAVLSVPILAFLPLLLLRAEANHSAAYEERKNLTRVAWEMYAANPVAGVGYGTYDTVKRAFLPEDWSGWLYTVHNQYLLVLAEAGTVGILGFAILLAGIFWNSLRGVRRIEPAYRPLQIAIVAGLVAIAWEMIWDMYNGRQQGYILWYLVALSVILPRVLSAMHPRDAT
jgi:O-antigen ligase